MAQIQLLAGPIYEDDKIGKEASILKDGSKGKEVTALQRWLMSLGLNPGPIDGIYGPMTASAVALLQRTLGRNVDGVFDVELYKAGEADFAKGAASKIRVRQEQKVAPMTQTQALDTLTHVPQPEMVPFYKQKWFMPALGGVAVLGLAYFAMKNRGAAQEQPQTSGLPDDELAELDAELEGLVKKSKRRAYKRKAKSRAKSKEA